MENKTRTSRGLLKTVIGILFYVALAVLITLLGTLLYFSDTWKGLSYSELLFHLKTSIAGTNPEMIISALIKYALPALVAFVVLVVIRETIRKKKVSILRRVSAGIMAVLVLLNGIVLYRYNSTTHVFSDFINAALGRNNSDFVEKNYVNPSDVSITFPETKRNLIYIYLESMETSFSDKENGGAFEDNYIPRLTKLSEANDNFQGDSNVLNGGIVLPGTNWTSGALFGQTCGLPLELPIDEGQLSNSDEFFPQLITMGDLLEDEGYTNVLEMGSSANFGGMRAYYEKHGNYLIHDYDYALAEGLIPEGYYEFWGYEDEKLFGFAKKEILELASKDAPFNFTMFTMDTHCEDGYVCHLCDNKYGDNQYANVLSCSDKQVSDFVRWIQKQDFYDNTTIVITGDHTTMDADFCDSVSDDYQRKTYTCIMNSAVKPQNNTHREYATIDLFPTILAALGVEMDSDRLGCGTNLYGKEQTLIEEQGKETCISEFGKGSLFVESMTKVVVDESAMEAAKDAAYLEVADENGMTRFRLNRADNINRLNIENIRLVTNNSRTGETKEYDMEVQRVRAGWHGVVHSDIPFDEIKNLNCEVYITVDKYENYLLKKFTSNEFEIWDVKWDVD